MDFETLAVAKSYTNQQILNSGQGNGNLEPLIINMLDYGFDTIEILEQFEHFTSVSLINADSLKEKILNRKNDQIILNMSSNLDKNIRISANCHILDNNGIIQLYSKSAFYLGYPYEFTFILILGESNVCIVIKENVVERLHTLPTYLDVADEGKFLRIINGEAAWVSLDDVSEVGA